MLVLLYFVAYLKIYIHQTHTHIHERAFLFAFSVFYSSRRAPALPLKYFTRSSSLGFEFEFYTVCAFFPPLSTASAIIFLRCRVSFCYMLHYL